MTSFTESVVEDAALALRQGAVIVTFGLPGKTTGKTTGKTHDAVLTLLAAEPSLSIPEVAKQIGKGPRATERIIRSLRETGKIKRIGPAKGGYWKVLP